MRQLKQLGEFGFIRTVSQSVRRKDPAVFCGIGDDAAVLRMRPGCDVLCTTDMIIEDKHFRRNEATPFEIGWKAMAVNISDIAAMGGIPRFAVAAVGLPGDLPVRDAKKILAGMLSCAGRFKTELVGGDTNASPKMVLAVTILGEAERGRALTRAGAKLHDRIFVTGDRKSVG